MVRVRPVQKESLTLKLFTSGMVVAATILLYSAISSERDFWAATVLFLSCLVVLRAISLSHRVLEETTRQLEIKVAELGELNGELDARAGQSQADLMELRQAQEQIEAARREAERANQAKSEFLSRMSHELRTPLNAILGFGQILEASELAPVQRESAHHILKGGHHLLVLINEVLDIARVESGHSEFSIEPVAVADIATESCALLSPLAADRNVLLRMNLEKLEIFHVMADYQRLKQVFINLLSNAVKYNRVGGTVDIDCREITAGRVRIEVVDTGFGIATEDLTKVFTPFERLNAAHSGIEGTGLGLALSQRLIEAMGGSLTVVSIPGEGATFFVDLPLAQRQLLGDAPPANSLLFAPRELLGSNYTVLCIEDNLSNLRLMEAVFGGRPEITLIASMQGSLGLDLASKNKPDLILLDLNLPDMSGKEVLAKLQQSEATQSIPVVVISADATTKQIDHMLAAGARAYLTKPLQLADFIQTVDDILHQTSDRKTAPGELILSS